MGVIVVVEVVVVLVIPVAYFSTSTWFLVEGRFPWLPAQRTIQYGVSFALYIHGFFVASSEVVTTPTAVWMAVGSL